MVSVIGQKQTVKRQNPISETIKWTLTDLRKKTYTVATFITELNQKLVLSKFHK